jgi:hypothetical protein
MEPRRGAGGKHPRGFRQVPSTGPGLATDEPTMHAWLFRNRERLRLILGLSPPVGGAEQDAIPAGSRGQVRRMVARKRRKGRPQPGQIARRGTLVLLLPMPRRSR